MEHRKTLINLLQSHAPQKNRKKHSISTHSQGTIGISCSTTPSKRNKSIKNIFPIRQHKGITSHDNFILPAIEVDDKKPPSNNAPVRTAERNHSIVIYQFKGEGGMMKSSSQNLLSIPQTTQAISHPMMWLEIKSTGQAIFARAYHTCVYHKKRLILFGGRDYDRGPMNDLGVVNIEGDDFIWNNLQLESQKSSPKPVSGHVSVVKHDRMFVFGGLSASLIANDILYSLELFKFQWTIIKHKGDQPIGVDSHSGVLYKDQIFYFGGFNTASTSYINTVQVYDIGKQTWTNLQFDGFAPSPRSNHSAVCVGDSMYVYGGRNDGQIFGDMWCLDLIKLKWKPINWNNPSSGPLQRWGHVILNQGNYIVLFGGISGMLREKNDLWTFNLKNNTWELQDQASDGHNVESPELDVSKSRNGSTHLHNRPQQKIPTMRPIGRIFSPSKLQRSPRKTQNSSIHSAQEDEPDEQDQLRELKKKELLKVEYYINYEHFKMSIQEQRSLVVYTPYSTQMQNSIDNLNRGMRRKELHTHPYVYDNKQVRPLPRSGATITQTPDGWIAFGGDRHRLSFNDLWKLNPKYLKMGKLL